MALDIQANEQSTGNGSRDDAVLAQHNVLNQLAEHYPAHLSKDELKKVLTSDRLSDEDAEDALADLVAQGIIHRQDDAEYYWLTRPVAYLAQIEWSPATL